MTHSQVHSTPLVVLLDLDGTIIGDITQQIASFELAKSLKASGIKSIIDKNDLKAKLKNGLVRPFFDTFIKALNTSHTPFEIFIYTASEKTWAEYVIKNIESIYNFKFNRPIFSRQFCMFDVKDREYKKSISLIRPTLLKALKKKYSVSFSKQDISHNIVIIDNNNVYQSNDQKHLLLCPTYNYRVPENVASFIKESLYKSYYQVIYQILKKYVPTLQLTSNYYQFQQQFYSYYVSFIETQMKNNGRYIQDKYWLYLKETILGSNIRRFDESSVKFIANAMRSKMGMPTNQHIQGTQAIQSKYERQRRFERSDRSHRNQRHQRQTFF
jgi:hypothetical protein